MRSRLTGIVLPVLFLLMANVSVFGEQIKLWGSQKQGTVSSGPVQEGNTVRLQAVAGIIDVSLNGQSFVVFRNGAVFVTIEKGQSLTGNFPPGEYILRTSIGSASILLDTNVLVNQFKLWGRQTALVSPRQEGNRVVLSGSATITESTYDGTEGVGIFRMDQDPNHAFLHYLSPHNPQNPGPKVIDWTGAVVGKTLIGLVLPAGVYALTPGRRTVDEIVYAEITIDTAVGSGAFLTSKDYVRKGEQLAGDGIPDWCFPIQLLGTGTVTGISINNISGQYSIWDTVAANNLWLTAVVVNDRILNKSDGSVSFPISGDVDLELYVADNGSLEGKNTRYKITVSLSDGRVVTLDPAQSRLAHLP